MYLGYAENTFSNPQQNGQISGVIWNTQGDDNQRRYDYTYDNAGRLIKADFKEQAHPGDGWANNKMDFSVSGYTGKITYDLNGNLLSMLHKGVMPGTASPITVDDLRYSYTSASLTYTNKLQSVTDQMTMTTANGLFNDFKDGTNGNNPDYVYDANGNVVVDLNKNVKDISQQNTNGIRYNFLDKPDLIRIQGKGTISIVYSADGEKLQRIFTPETGSVTTTTYISQFIYQSTGNNPDGLSFINFEEGRIRVITPTSQNNGYDLLTVDGNMDLPNNKKGVYDYFILDYQQNVRMILSEQTRVASNTATMETSRGTIEEPIFGQVGGGNEVALTRYPAASTNWQNANIQNSVSRLGNNAGYNVGPNTLQKVMAGDVVNANVQYYYPQSGTGYNPSFVSNVLSTLLVNLTNGPTSNAVKGGASNITNALGVNTDFIDAVRPSTANGTPLAYLTILFFDERFNFISAADGGTYQQQVHSSVTVAGASLNLSAVKAPKNGYVFVFVSNQSDQSVYFDNLSVSIAQGHIIEENHYYSFGLKITAISSRKFQDSYDGETKNNYGMQGAFSEMDDDIGWNDFALRSYDAQIGRFMQMDPFDQFPSPFTGMGNNPVYLIDPSGGVGVPCPGTSALSIFLDNAMYAIGNALNSLSSVISIAGRVSSVTQTSITLMKMVNTGNIVNGKVSTNAVGTNTPRSRYSSIIPSTIKIAVEGTVSQNTDGQKKPALDLARFYIIGEFNPNTKSGTFAIYVPQLKMAIQITIKNKQIQTPNLVFDESITEDVATGSKILAMFGLKRQVTSSKKKNLDAQVRGEYNTIKEEIDDAFNDGVPCPYLILWNCAKERIMDAIDDAVKEDLEGNNTAQNYYQIIRSVLDEKMLFRLYLKPLATTPTSGAIRGKSYFMPNDIPAFVLYSGILLKF